MGDRRRIVKLAVSRCHGMNALVIKQVARTSRTLIWSLITDRFLFKPRIAILWDMKSKMALNGHIVHQALTIYSGRFAFYL